MHCCRCRWPRAPTCCRRSFPPTAASATTASRSKELHGLFVNERIRRPPRHPRAGRDRQLLRTAGPAPGRSRLEPAGARRGARMGTRAVAGRRHADAADFALLQPCPPQLAQRTLRRGRRPRRVARLAHRAVRRPQRSSNATPPMRSWPRCARRRSSAGPGRQGHAQATAGPARARRPGDDARIPGRCTSPTRWGRRCWACMRPAIRNAAGRIPTCATAWTATTTRRASFSAGRPRS